MIEAEKSRVQGLSGNLQAGLAVDPVADQGQSVVRGVDADLVLAAGVQDEAQE